MMMNFSRKLIHPLLAAFALFAMTPFSRSVHAAGMNPNACGTFCMANGGGMFRPFNGMPFFPPTPNYYAYNTGQMSFYGPATLYPNSGMVPSYVSPNMNYMMMPTPYSGYAPYYGQGAFAGSAF